MIEILTGDFRELSRDLADDSVDLVLTDPVYDRIDDYRFLAETAARVLRPGGNCVAQVWNFYLVDVATAMRSNLRYVQTMAEVYSFSHQSIYQDRIRVGFKPWLWFSKGEKRNGNWIFNRFNGSGRDKSAHRWGDNIDFYRNVIERLTDPGDLVLDPFLGGGTTAVACLQTGRRCIGYEIDAGVAEDARRRVARERLFVAQPEPVQFTLDSAGLPRCKSCGAILEGNGGPGRKREYCNDLCRQRAYRDRQRNLSRNAA